MSAAGTGWSGVRIPAAGPLIKPPATLHFLGSEPLVELEVVEKYNLLGTTKYVVRIKESSVKFHISAKDEEEAIKKARDFIESRRGLEYLLAMLKGDKDLD